MRLPLLGGSYTSRSIIASAQKCINYYPELNPKSAIVPVTHYQRPGIRPITNFPAGPVRGLYRASNGTEAYAVAASTLYRLDTNFNFTALGNITAGRTNPVSMVDNGTQLMVVDGSPNGWIVTLGAAD